MNSIGFVALSTDPVGAFKTVMVHCLSSGRPGLQYTSPGMAAVAVMKEFNVKRIALLTPYRPALHNAFAPYLARYGIEVVADLSLAHSMDLVTDDDIGRAPVNRMQAELSQLLEDAQPVDAAFVSCAAFSVKPSDLVEMTGAFGCPVLAGVHFTAWHVMDLVGEHGLRDKFAFDFGLLRLSQSTILMS